MINWAAQERISTEAFDPVRLGGKTVANFKAYEKKEEKEELKRIGDWRMDFFKWACCLVPQSRQSAWLIM